MSGLEASQNTFLQHVKENALDEAVRHQLSRHCTKGCMCTHSTAELAVTRYSPEADADAGREQALWSCRLPMRCSQGQL